jgi:hypothetical protein
MRRPSCHLDRHAPDPTEPVELVMRELRNSKSPYLPSVVPPLIYEDRSPPATVKSSLGRTPGMMPLYRRTVIWLL